MPPSRGGPVSFRRMETLIRTDRAETTTRARPRTRHGIGTANVLRMGGLICENACGTQTQAASVRRTVAFRSLGRGVRSAPGHQTGTSHRRDRRRAGPVERLFQPVVAPEHLAVLREEGRRAEDAARAAPPRRSGLAGASCWPRLCAACEDRGCVEARARTGCRRPPPPRRCRGPCRIPRVKTALREGRSPAAVEAEQGHPGGDQPVLREGIGPVERQPQPRRLALHVAPHVAALGRGRG